MLGSNKFMVMPYILGIVALCSFELRPWIRIKYFNDLHSDDIQTITVMLLVQTTQSGIFRYKFSSGETTTS